jgi:hypothetical protein
VPALVAGAAVRRLGLEVAKQVVDLADEVALQYPALVPGWLLPSRLCAAR